MVFETKMAGQIINGGNTFDNEQGIFWITV